MQTYQHRHNVHTTKCFYCFLGTPLSHSPFSRSHVPSLYHSPTLPLRHSRILPFSHSSSPTISPPTLPLPQSAMLFVTLTLSDPGYFRQLTIRGGGGFKSPPPTISKTIVSIFTISYM